MKDKNYSYRSYLEYELQQFTNEAKKEKYYTDLKGQLDQIQSRIADNKRNELTIYRDEIRMLLEEEIVSHYYLERGSIEAGFKYDNDIKMASALLHDMQQYKNYSISSRQWLSGWQEAKGFLCPCDSTHLNFPAFLHDLPHELGRSRGLFRFT